MHSGGHGAFPREQYFYLSHAYPPAASIDPWVLKFFNDVHTEVRLLVGVSGETDLGFLDVRHLGPARDGAAVQALRIAKILVPLYAPGYLDTPSSAAELAAFQRRMANPAADLSIEHIQAVIWSPIAPSQEYPNLERAVELGSEYPEYLELGLSAMCRLNAYREHYAALVKRLASRIVGIAERSGVTLAPKPAIEGLAEVTNEVAFVIAVIAPTESRLPAHRESRCYGRRSLMWRPFRNAHDLAIAEFTSAVASTFMLPTRVVDFDAGDTTLETSPGLILVDPWILEHDDGPALLHAAFETLRQWVSLVVVVDRNDPQYAIRGNDLASRVMRMRTSSQRGHLVRDAQEYEQAIRTLIDRMRRRYLRERPAFPPNVPRVRRPSLRNPEPPTPSTTEEDQ